MARFVAKLSVVRPLFVCISLLIVASAHAQLTSLDNTTVPPAPGLGHDYIKMLGETVNPANGSVSMRIDIPLPKGRGMTLPFALIYSSSAAFVVRGDLSEAGGGDWGSNTNNPGDHSWSTSIPYIASIQGASSFYNNFGPWPPLTYSCTYINNYVMRDGSGSPHQLGLSIAQNTGSEDGCDQAPWTPGNVLTGNDDFLRAVTTYSNTNFPPNAPTSVTVADAEGTVYTFPSQPNIDASSVSFNAPQSPNYASRFGYSFWGPVSTIEDRNGNLVTVGTSITDDAGRQVLTFGSTSGGQTYTVLGQPSPYAFSNRTGTTQVNNFALAENDFGYPSSTPCMHIRPTTISVGGVQSLTLPNGQRYQFQYDGTYGLLSKIIYPNGGYISYTWGVNPQSEIVQLPQSQDGVHYGNCYAIYDLPAITSRTVSYDGTTAAQTQSFSYQTYGLSSSAPGPWTSKTTTVTTSDHIAGTSYTTVYNYLPAYNNYNIPNVNGTSLVAPTAVESKIVDKDAGGSVLRTVYKSWGGVSGQLLQCELTQLDNGLISGAWYAYGPGGQIIDKKEYDYGVITAGPCFSPAPSNPTRETVTTYQSFAPTAIFPSSASIFDRPSSVKVYSGGTAGTLVAETDYVYDGTAVTFPGSVTGHDDTNYGTSNNNRGNLTKKTVRCLQSCTDSVTTFKYDTTGQVLSKADPCGNGTCAEMSGSTHTTNYTYADSYTLLSGVTNNPYTPATQTNAYLTKIVDNLGHIAKFTYDYDNGELTSVTDPNTQVTSYVYNDLFWRPTSISFPDGGATTYAYNDFTYNATAHTPSVTTTKVVTAGTNIVTTAAFDGMRHPLLTTMTDPDGVTSTSTTYDGLGKPYTVTNPYRSTSDSTYGITTTQFDALERPTLIVEPDGSRVIATYSGNCVAQSDEAGRPRVTCSDAFGRITQVLEPGTGAAAGGQGTGTVTLAGAVQSRPTNATSGRGTIQINGYEQVTTYYPCGVSSCPTTLYDDGNVTVTVNGFGKSVAYGQNSTGNSVASALAAALNVSASPVTATANGVTITLTAKATGATTNYTLSSSSSSNKSQYFSYPSFSGQRSGATLTGGVNAGTVYDSGTVSVTVDGFQASVSYSQSMNNTPALLANSLAAAFGAGAPVTASASASILTLTAKQYGFDSNYQLSTATTWNTQFFASASFTEAAGATLTGGTNGTDGSPALTTLYTYDVLNNLTCAVQKGTDTTAFTSCAASPSTWRPRSFTYDSMSRLISSTNPEVNTGALSGTLVATQYAYDLNSNLMSKTFPAPNQQGTTMSTISYCYDDDNRLTKKSYAASTSCASPAATYTYDESGCQGASSCSNVGRRTSMTDAGGSENWAYDTMGRVLKDVRITNGLPAKTATYTYLPYVDGSISSVQYPSGRVVNYTTGTAERLLTASDSTTTYASGVHYAPQGSRAAMGYGAGTSAIVLTEIYNNRLQPCWIYGTSGTALATSHQCADTATTGNFLDLKYNFNPGLDNGNVVGITNNRDTTRSTVFAYDLLNRLISGQTTSTHATSTANCWGEAYGVDAWGNRSSLANLNSQYTGCTEEQSFSATASVQNQLPLTGNKYDSAGNLIQAPVGGITNSYAYDTENRLQSITGLSTTTNYIYDGDGKRVEKTGGTAKLYWYGADGTVLDETDSTGSVTNANFSEYIYFAGHRVARRDSGGNVFYYLADHLGTSRAMGEVASGQTTATLCYDADFYPFGGERTVVNLCGQNYKFAGKERDSESGLDNFGARYNASSLGRFMTPDPVDILKQKLVDPQQWNMYSFVRNNPLRFVDPTGKAVELTGDDAERIRKLDAYKAAVGAKAGASLYDNLYKGKHYLGVQGKMEDFKSANTIANKLGGIIADQRVAVVSLVPEGTQKAGGHVLGSVDKGLEPAATYAGPGGATTYATSGDLGSLPAKLSDSGNAVPLTLGEVLIHEIGEVDAQWYHGADQRQGDGVRIENEMRRRDGVPTRNGHDIPYDVPLDHYPY